MALANDLKQLEQYYFKKRLEEDAVHQVSGGFSGVKNYRIEDSGKTYFARFMSSKRPLKSREKECLITDYAGKIGVGPKVYYQNSQQGIILTEFIHGRTANYNDLRNEPNRNLIIANIKKLHQATQLNFPKAKTLAAEIRELLKSADSNGFREQLQTLKLNGPLNKLCQCELNNQTAALIHGDWHADNILITQSRIYFIDWGEAGTGDPFADISWHAISFPPSLHNKFLEYYFDCADIAMRQKLHCYYCLRVFRMAVWCASQAKTMTEDCDSLLIDIMKQQNLPDPFILIKDRLINKMTLKKPYDFLFFSATMLKFLSELTKTDIFHSAIEALSHHV